MLLKGIEAHITVDGTELTEYAPTVDTGRSIATCWIPSEASKTFSLSWRNSEPFSFPIGGYSRIDGVDCKGEKPIEEGMCGHRVQSDVFTSPTLSSTFMFTTSESSDDGSCCASGLCTKDVGDIVLEIWGVDTIREVIPWDFELPKRQVCYRLKNEITHCVALRKPKHVGIKKILGCHGIHPIARFVFKYRSADVLKSLGIMTKDASLSRVQMKRKSSEEEHTIKTEEGSERDSYQEQERRWNAPGIVRDHTKRRRLSETASNDISEEKRPRIGSRTMKLEYLLVNPRPAS
ncbi:hypothetical protein BDQ12DRAFT_686352 [Crucibulum laeve]|uniref:DUF7918 domain-containing protein n=1 Tax=Crucibulum laeve TaxID=68775 RepID=A0A5C3LXR9_9AGAR|nr:hypothetical protein BDQ12DRAFT_686352 [Crucibulum laeve]